MGNIPSEIISSFLSTKVDDISRNPSHLPLILSCRLVCKSWNSFIRPNEDWRKEFLKFTFSERPNDLHFFKLNSLLAPCSHDEKGYHYEVTPYIFRSLVGVDISSYVHKIVLQYSTPVPTRFDVYLSEMFKSGETQFLLPVKGSKNPSQIKLNRRLLNKNGTFSGIIILPISGFYEPGTGHDCNLIRMFSIKI